MIGAMPPVNFDAPIMEEGQRIRAQVYDSLSRGGTSLGLKDNVLIRTSPLMPPSYTHHSDGRTTRAYWIYKKVKKAIYGKVTVAYELEKLPGSPSSWRLTGRHVAVKMLLWEQIRRLSGRFEEDPIKEIAAMQYLHG
ncbi:hypothetical protein TrRE_jg3162, partial [Triparma retinervis]